MRTTEEAIKEDTQVLKEIENEEWSDSENYHAEYDRLLEKRLHELDFEYMEALENEYDKSDMWRRYA